jgi:SpoVK/Ycf46/Vps4 family AAA+-type ATPase
MRLISKDSNKISKNVTIDFITDNKKINNLYKAVDWYLSTKNDTDLIKESPLKMFFDDDIEMTVPGTKISKKISQNKYKSIQFNNHEIHYLLATNLVTVYSDKERKRENFSINLSTTIPKDAKIDILEEFCQYCLDEFIKYHKPTVWIQKIYVNDTNGEWKSQNSNNKRKIETIVLKKGQVEIIKNDVTDFMNSETWYDDRDIPYTRGYLFHGPPGTGKTSLIKALSTHTKRHMHYLMLNNISNDDQLFELLSKIDYSKTILIVEDIDCMTKIIDSRNNKNNDDDLVNQIKKEIDIHFKSLDQITKQSQLTLSGLLNAIDGIFNNNGRIMIMTSNCPESIDAALLRPGRIDRKILFDKCDNYQIENIFKMMYDVDYQRYTNLKNIPENTYSPAEITSLFLKYRNEPDLALLNIRELCDDKFVIHDRKFFGKEVEKIIN